MCEEYAGAVVAVSAIVLAFPSCVLLPPVAPPSTSSCLPFSSQQCAKCEVKWRGRKGTGRRGEQRFLFSSSANFGVGSEGGAPDKDELEEEEEEGVEEEEAEGGCAGLLAISFLFPADSGALLALVRTRSLARFLSREKKKCCEEKGKGAGEPAPGSRKKGGEERSEEKANKKKKERK